jgi:vacuolar protein sorting-associated protein 13A/C
LQPIEEAKKNGVIGLFKGTGKGLAGLIIKPIAGVLDATAKTAEGISKSATYLDDKEINLRSRIPRVFYDKCRYFKEYSEPDSLVQQILNNQFPNLVLIGNY